MNLFPHSLVPFVFLFFTYGTPISAQMITGVWKGKINNKKVELKIIRNGDSLTGTSYYYDSEKTYRRYSIRGYFDEQTNSAVWWDDQMLDEKINGKLITNPGKIPYLSSADFNCPGSDKMYLDGSAAYTDQPERIRGPVKLEKTSAALFNDEWDYIIDNYTSGANDPYIIDSIASIAYTQNQPIEELSPVQETEDIIAARPNNQPQGAIINKQIVSIPPPVRKVNPVPAIEDKFTRREKVFTKEIPVSGDSIELRFYDNAEIDGDSISLFLNDKLIFTHIRLTGSPYIIKLPVTDLKETNELIMVAENLGAIPPNTSYMIALVGDKRYDAQLASTEQSSAMIRLVRKL